MLKMNELIIIEQLPVIKQTLKNVSEEIAVKIKYALSLECTDETVKTIKNVRTDLKKHFEEIEAKRKAVKQAVLEPYEQFDAVYKELITEPFKNADLALKNAIDSVENGLKLVKENEVKAYFKEYLASKDIDFVTFEQATNVNITLSASVRNLKEDCKAFIDRICNDLELINTQEDKAEIMVEYKQTLNASRAITTALNRRKAIAEEKARQLQREQAELERKANVTKVVEVAKVEEITKVVEPVAPLIAPVIENKVITEDIITVCYTITDTSRKIEELKMFLEMEGYKYEQIN